MQTIEELTFLVWLERTSVVLHIPHVPAKRRKLKWYFSKPKQVLGQAEAQLTNSSHSEKSLKNTMK